ncbi:TMEM1 family protein-like protein [Boeremia exigua]|uniref:TMEM1 family protein-like protein n=1 Tax=Boeremia exigua TaxID=749465 RepID=UPI001E8D8C3B|nr:TMEM1 family protein-like protein [Boeremia exigua]KAH6642789.1 TMEM1 family protein-like protein [Boeremia exigua]
MSVAEDVAPPLGAQEDAHRPQHGPAVMDGLSSSKVTVEYHDPSGVFPLIQEDLTARLPLRNLHWKAPTRPLRSIESLHVDLVPSSESAQDASAEKERRHQIPGLRRTPYLKVYLFRCDDSDAYKGTARKQLRDWMKDHTPPAQSSAAGTQENHDAYEWMIIHVVLPGTPAASQPRGSGSAAAGEKEKSASVFKRTTTTILEKIRADFNIASKTAPDRIAQIRLKKERVPPQMLPAASATSTAAPETQQEHDGAWTDVITKFKTLILSSFDLRVSQYEDDIRKNDAQRSLPGWNFNTFFVLKEGLARGFESTGLVDDALLGYDELSIGLDTVLRDQANDGSVLQMLSHSEDLYQRVVEVLEQSQGDASNSEDHAQFHDDKPIDAQKKDYRGLILANNISIFEFRVYIFARQMSILLRMGNSQSSLADLANKLQPRPNASVAQKSVDDSQIGTKSTGHVADTEDLLSLAELCTRALNFVTFAGRLLREDLMNGAKAHDAVLPEQLVDNLVRSWTFSALDQVLRETSTSSLPFTRYAKDASTSSPGKSLSFSGRGKEQKTSVPEPKTMIHPARSSSRSGSTDPPYLQPSTTGQVVYENGSYQDRPAPSQQGVINQSKNGLMDLAGQRAQLIGIQRRLLEHVGKAMGWAVGWAAFLPSLSQSEDFTEVDLNEDEEDEEAAEEKSATKETAKSVDATSGISATALVNALSSLDHFRQFYETLSDQIFQHYRAAGQVKSAESITGDLAALRYELGDFRAAAMYFGSMAGITNKGSPDASLSLFAKSRWNTVVATMLKMYARCLKKLNRKDEYVRTLLDLLARSSASRISFSSASKRASDDGISNMPPDWLNDDKVDTGGVLNELVNYSQQLPYDVSVQMADYFTDIAVEPYIRHYDDKDGFQLRLQFRHILEDEVEIRAAKIRLVSATSTTAKDVWLETPETMTVEKGLTRVWLGCNLNITGPYTVDKIILEAKRIAFVHEPVTKSESPTPLGIIASASVTSLKAAKKARVQCFPRAGALDARVYLSHFIHIDKPRHIEISCSAGANEIEHAEIRLKSASAGLRLRTGDTSVESEDGVIENNEKPGVISIKEMPANSSITLKIPYDMETILQDLTVKAEIDYHTANGEFQYISSFTVPVELPLDVNVHDHFKSKSLFSKFNIKTANQVPLELLDVELEGSEEFDVHAPRRSKEPLHVFPKQPVAVTYKIVKKEVDAESASTQGPSTGSLALAVEYRCLNEDVLDRLREHFAAAVVDSPVARLSRLLIAVFVTLTEQKVIPYQYEKIALLDKVDMGTFEELDWAECLDSLPQPTRDETRLWLQTWLKNNKIVYLSESILATPSTAIAPASPYPPRRMIITVSIPQTHILHTASLDLVSSSPDAVSSYDSNIATIGQPLHATLRISHTRRWASSSSLVTAANLSSATDPMDFVYTLDASPDQWLIAGQRRAHFTATDGEPKTFPITLIPLKAGHALLPSVDIRARIKPREKDDEKTVEEEEVLNCETDCLSFGESVEVVPDVRRSTVGVGDMSLGSPRSVVWLEGVGQSV